MIRKYSGRRRPLKKKVTRRKKVYKSKGTKRRAPQKRTSTKRRKASSNGSFEPMGGGGNDFSRSRRTVGRYPALKPNRLLSLIKVGMNERIERFQGITNFDTNTGFFSIANRLNSTTGEVSQPMHVYMLSSFKNTDGSPVPQPGRAYGWTSEAGTADVIRTTLAGQDHTGTVITADWSSEEMAGPDSIPHPYPLDFPNCSKLLHEWTQVKLNLYGARRRPTWFNIDFVRVKNEHANFFSAAASNDRFKELINALTGNMTYSNLQTRDTSALKYLTFVKRLKYFIPAEDTTDLNTSCGKIKEVKIFMKHGKVLDMRSHENRVDLAQLGHKQEDGIDYELLQYPLNTCADSQQLFMIIRAWSPTRHSATTPQWLSVGTNYTPLPSDIWTAKADPTVAVHDVPSYDMILRNKYSVPS